MNHTALRAALAGLPEPARNHPEIAEAETTLAASAEWVGA